MIGRFLSRTYRFDLGEIVSLVILVMMGVTAAAALAFLEWGPR